MKENKVIKKAFGRAMEEVKVPPSVERRVFRRRAIPFAFPLVGLAAGFLIGVVFVQFWHAGEEYLPMSEEKVQGVHVVFDKDVKMGQVEEFLRERGLSMVGPTQAGTFLIKNAKEEHIKELKRLNYIKEVFW